jgi:alpha-beta hydrolase superfamily lysophospholipase
MYDDAAHEILREGDAIRLRALEAIDSFLDRNATR